jgi:hypothetical protein
VVSAHPHSRGALRLRNTALHRGNKHTGGVGDRGTSSTRTRVAALHVVKRCPSSRPRRPVRKRRVHGRVTALESSALHRGPDPEDVYGGCSPCRTSRAWVAALQAPPFIYALTYVGTGDAVDTA